MPYRIGKSIGLPYAPIKLTVRTELSPNKRAGCKNTECKKAGIKFEKGECRFATQVTIDGHTSWMYKHWYVVSSPI